MADKKVGMVEGMATRVADWIDSKKGEREAIVPKQSAKNKEEIEDHPVVSFWKNILNGGDGEGYITDARMRTNAKAMLQNRMMQIKRKPTTEEMNSWLGIK